jgi:hypothetical protein
MSSRASYLCLLVLPVLGIGCGSASGPGRPDGSDVQGGQTGEESVSCRSVARQELTPGETSPLGFSAEQLLADAAGEHQLALRWADGTTSALMLGVRLVGDAVEFAEREYREDPSGRESAGGELGVPEIAIQCNDVLELPVALRFVTADAAFDESWSATLRAESLASARLFLELDLDALGGSYRVTQVDPTAFDNVRAFLSLEWREGIWTGSISGEAEMTAGPGNDGSVSARGFSVATF